MEPVTWLIVIGGALLLLGGGWLMGRFLLHLLKHAVIATIIGLVVMVVWYYEFARPVRDPNVGKRAYLIRDNRYLGEVLRAGKDDRLGDVWIVRQPDGYEAKFPKARVTLKEK